MHGTKTTMMTTTMGGNAMMTTAMGASNPFSAPSQTQNQFNNFRPQDKTFYSGYTSPIENRATSYTIKH